MGTMRRAAISVGTDSDATHHNRYDWCMPTENNSHPHMDVSRIIPWLEKHWKTQSCPVCSSDDWEIETDPYRLDPIRIPSTGVHIVRNDTRVVIPVTCKTCGYMLMFDAFKTGALWFDTENNNDE